MTKKHNFLVEEDKKAADLTAGLGNPCGTNGYHRNELVRNVVVTDGVIEFCEKYGAYWAWDLMASYQIEPPCTNKTYQYWDFYAKGGKATAVCRDGNNRYVLHQDIHSTSLPDGNASFKAVWNDDGSGHKTLIICLPMED